jgi:hypothetical protein
MNPEALILRRCYPVPVTFADLRAAASLLEVIIPPPWLIQWRDASSTKYRSEVLSRWHAALKQVTGAIDEVYAVVDGREVRVAIVKDGGHVAFDEVKRIPHVWDLLTHADEQGYWERPHEVRLDLSTRPVSHGEVARAVLVGQEALERGGVVRS